MAHLMLARHMLPIIAARKVGGIRFIRLGRVNISLSVSRRA